MHDFNHDCSKVILKVTLSLDGELSSDEEKRFLDEIQRCPHCLEKFHIEKSFKEFLVNKVQKKEVSTRLIDKIKEKIKSLVLDE